jgi:hypothetical protein
MTSNEMYLVKYPELSKIGIHLTKSQECDLVGRSFTYATALYMAVRKGRVRNDALADRVCEYTCDLLQVGMNSCLLNLRACVEILPPEFLDDIVQEYVDEFLNSKECE